MTHAVGALQGLKLKLDASPLSTDEEDVDADDWLDQEEPENEVENVVRGWLCFGAGSAVWSSSRPMLVDVCNPPPPPLSPFPSSSTADSPFRRRTYSRRSFEILTKSGNICRL